MEKETQQNPYTMTAADINAFLPLVHVENTIGSGRPPLTNAIVVGFISGLDNVSGTYPSMANSLLKGWVDQFYSNLIFSRTEGRGRCLLPGRCHLSSRFHVYPHIATLPGQCL